MCPDIVVEGFSDKGHATTTSSSEKNLSTYEQKYDKGTRKPIKDYIRPTSIGEDQDFSKSTINEKESDENMSETETEKGSVSTSTRLGNIFELKGVLNNLGVKEFRGSRILGKVRGKIKSKMKTKGAIMGSPESPKLGMPKPFGGKFLDGSIKEAVTMLIMSRATGGIEVKETKEAKEQRDKSRRQEAGSVVHNKEKFEQKGISVSW